MYRNTIGRWTVLGTLGLGLAGCSTAWDEVTSRNFRVNSLWERSDPMTVLQTETDGDTRAKAYRALKEPRANGGNDIEQDRVMQMLAQAAVSDPQPLCRLAAIQTLGRFSDPRAVQTLVAASEAAGQLPSETAGPVRCAALASLGSIRQNTAIPFLVQTAIKPTPTDVNEREQNQAREARLTALRSLKNYDGSPEVETAMAKVIQADKDVAIVDRARETYTKVTGREPPEHPAIPAPKPAGSGDDIKLTGGAN